MKKKSVKRTKQQKNSTDTLFTKQNIIWLAILLAFTFILFTPSLDNEFVKWDDDWVIYDNPNVTNFSFDKLKIYFVDYFNGQYSPLFMSSVILQYQMGGGSPVAFHIFGILFHLINILLVFWMIKLLFKKDRIAFIVTVLFAVHSLQVESVVWISAQKVTLYTIFFLASCISYIQYVNTKKMASYVLSMVFFILSFMAKEQAVTLAVSLIAIDYIMKRNLLDKKVILEKIPFLVIALIMGIVTIMSTRSGEFFTDEEKKPLFEQLAYSSYAFVQYLLQLIFPYRMSAFHPYPYEGSESMSPLLFAYVIPVLLIVYIFLKSFKKNPIISFSIFFFVINIALVLQIMPLRDFITADRYVYIPAIGFFLIIAWYADKFIEKKKQNATPILATLTVWALLLSIVSFQRANIWQDSLTLFTDVVEKYPESSVGWNNRGLALSNLDKNKEAIEDYKKAIKYNPSSVFCYNNIGISYKEVGNYKNAFISYDAAIKLSPNFAQAYFNRADAKSDKGDFIGAIADYQKFLELKPNYPKAYVSMGITKAKAGDFNAALLDLNTAVKLQPNNFDTYLNRGVIHLNLKNYKEAISDFNSTLLLRPNFNYAFFNRGLAKVSLGDQQGGCSDLQKAYQLGFQQAAGALQQYCK